MQIPRSHLDRRLCWNEHINHLDGKAAKKLSVIGMGGSIWGLNIADLRCLYISTVLPAFTYASFVWSTPNPGHGKNATQDKVHAFLTKIQRRAAHLISGSFRTTSSAAMDVEIFLVPVKERLIMAFNVMAGVLI